MSRLAAVPVTVIAFLTLPVTPAVAASDDAACPGQILPAESQGLHPLGQNVANPIATSAPGAAGTFVSDLARSDAC